MDGSAPTGRVLTVTAASIIQLEGEKIASDHAYFYRRTVDEQLGTSFRRRFSTKHAPIAASASGKFKDDSPFIARTTGALRIDSDVRNMR